MKKRVQNKDKQKQKYKVYLFKEENIWLVYQKRLNERF